MKIEIRKAEIKDAIDIAKIQTKTWLTTYKGIIPDDVLKERTMFNDSKINRFKDHINSNQHFLVASVDDKVVGYIWYGKSTLQELKELGEIHAFYILNEYQKMGIGRKLFNAAVNGLINDGYNKMDLTVAVGNDNALNFYIKMGGRIDHNRFDEQFKTEDNIIIFDNLQSIIDNNEK